ncbi:MAG TPA: ribose-phosphate pyrophosphokinase [Myxococcales bacterium]|nr:ribose-phosphate pyrophosphokinase [Myxococcales bacterium]
MSLVILAGTGNPPLAAAIAGALGLRPGAATVDRFPDGELRVEVHEDVKDKDVVLVQSMGPPSDRALLELVFLADAVRRLGAKSVTAAVPYLAYARQDSSAKTRGPLGARVVAELLQICGIQRLVALDLHSQAVEASFDVPVEHVSAIPLLADELASRTAPGSVVVSPDLGGVARAEAYARRLQLPVAVVRKTRLSGSDVSAGAVMGNVRGLSPIVVDDVISTGATIEAAVRALQAAGCSGDVTVAATHGLLVGGAIDRLGRLSLRRLLTTDSLPPPAEGAPFPIERVSVAGLMAKALAGASSG